MGSFSVIHRDTPFVFLAPGQRGAQDRLDAARGLGHLVLRPEHTRMDWRALDAEAGKFAAAFLMPRTGVLSHMLRNVTFERITTANHIWGGHGRSLDLSPA
ncbi:ImmA/IrrE family metallo-endopeptidase [Kitasatospora mediocidica]|uniref:ImmA/IrrE family metallo-endopeptidase n=1 Tax=Kitasatospora mediocidica TaxID=58352 RepID=UPI00055FF4C8|nr:ImmA/IrrE family metallo-endopeptidase [Kitasatospora mediocidica]